MGDPVTRLGQLVARERTAWQRAQAAELTGKPSELVKELRREAQETGDQKRDLWRQTYEEGRTLERKR